MRILLHICCGPCALYPLRELKDRYGGIAGFYYNPNIHPPSEYKRRRDALYGVEGKLGFKVVYPAYKIEEYFEKISSFEDSPERCRLCWELRLSKTAGFAKENGFDSWTTTLLISPYQNHEIIKELGKDIAKSKDIEFYYQDFRNGFRDSQKEAKKQGLYRQKYCGCVFSERRTI